MSEPTKNDKNRLYEADTLNILSGRLVNIQPEEPTDQADLSQRRRRDRGPVSGDTVRRIIERIKGI
jgi:hypothetical protein